MAAACAVYLAGSFAQTAAVNVPMNDALAEIVASEADSAAIWSAYCERWTA